MRVDEGTLETATLFMQNALAAVRSYECLFKCGKSSVRRRSHVLWNMAHFAWCPSLTSGEGTKLVFPP